jgi:uncharacterized protein YkwD
MDTRTAPHRKVRRAVATLLALAATTTATMAIAAPAAHASIAPRSANTIDRLEISEVRMINRFRTSHGLRALRIDGRLTRAAGWHAYNLGTHRMFSHTDYLGRDPFQRLRAFGYPSGDTWRGENIAAGNSGPAPTYSQWLNSPPHKANWMNRHYNSIGIARVQVPGSPYTYYWATTFGSRWTGPAAS